MGCGQYNTKLELRDMQDSGLYVCTKCGNNAFEFHEKVKE